MTKIEKEVKISPQTKVPLNITVSKEIYAWVTKLRGTSKLAEQAYFVVKRDLV